MLTHMLLRVTRAMPFLITLPRCRADARAIDYYAVDEQRLSLMISALLLMFRCFTFSLPRALMPLLSIDSASARYARCYYADDADVAIDATRAIFMMPPCYYARCRCHYADIDDALPLR